MKQKHHFRWLALLTCLLMGFATTAVAQEEEDDLQAYLDKLAAEMPQPPGPQPVRDRTDVTIPINLPVIDLSTFTSAQNRKNSLLVQSSVIFKNGTISAAAAFSGGGPLLKITNGAYCVLDETASVDASTATQGNCSAAVGVYGGSTFHQKGDVSAPRLNGQWGTAVYLNTSADTWIHESGAVNGGTQNPGGGTIIEPGQYTYDELKAKLDAIGDELDALNDSYDEASSAYQSLKNYLPENIQTQLLAKLQSARTAIDALVTRWQQLNTQLQSAATSEYGALNTAIETLAQDVQTLKASLTTELNATVEQIKTQAIEYLQGWATQFGNDVNALQTRVVNMRTTLSGLTTGDYFFERHATAAFTSQQNSVTNTVNGIRTDLGQIITDYNALLAGSSISTIADAVNFAQQLTALDNRLSTMTQRVTEAETQVSSLQQVYNSLAVNFPPEDQNYDIRPVGLTDEIQLGYKDHHEFTLTSSGMMYFEQVVGATFRLKDYYDNYAVVAAGSERLTGGTQEEATVWVGQSLGNGNYTIKEASTQRYMKARCLELNAAMIVSQEVQEWQFIATEADDMQAFLNLLAEDDTSGCEEEPLPGSDEPQNIVVPTCDCTPSTPFVLPRRPVVLRCGCANGPGYVPIPAPGGHGPRPQSFHPYHVPQGGHIWLKDLHFVDYVGGHHVIYVEGILEVDIDVVIDLDGWDWFIEVAPGGKVIWHPTPGSGGYMPRIKVHPGGTVEVPEGHLGYVDNGGTVNQTGGTIDKVHNTSEYHFKGGLIDFMDNYGTQTHESGTIHKVNNRAGGTYTMTGGEVNCTVVNQTDTIFVNCGTFYFYGGQICGYGSRLVYHGPGATMRIDGGTFCFDHVCNWWIEAWNDFYMPGDVDYGATVPILLNPGVKIIILYRWIINIHIRFIGGRPTPRYPVFVGGGDFVLGPGHIPNIIWNEIPDRWRWYFDDEEKTIEPRDEQVEDEDDLQAYLDWLAEHQDDTAASSEEQPQELNLQGRTIYLTHEVNIPAGCHVRIKNGTFVPKGSWTHDRVFYIPTGSSVRMENVTIDYSQRIYYVVNNVVVMRYLFYVEGHLYFGSNCHIKGWFDPDIAATDSYIPGACIGSSPTGAVYLNGGRFDNVVFYVNVTVNIYISVALNYDTYFYVPTACRYRDFRMIAPLGGYVCTLPVLNKIKLFGTNDWLPATDSGGYVCLFDYILLGDANGDGRVSVADVVVIVNHILSNFTTPIKAAQADISRDGRISVTDIVLIRNKILTNNH